MIRKVPKISTIRKNIHYYASKCGLLIIPKDNGLYDVFDIHMQYNVGTHENMDTVVRIVTDDLSSMVYRLNPIS